LLLQGSVRPGEYLMKRLTTTLGEKLCRALFVSGVDGLLSLDTQAHLREAAPKLRPRAHIHDEVVVGKMDFTGAMGTYFREVFFHVPHLIASQLNGQQNFAAAEQWYRHIFDPTANDDEFHDERERKEHDRAVHRSRHDEREHSDHSRHNEREHSDHGHHDDREHSDSRRSGRESRAAAAEEAEKASRDRVWRFIEFRNLDVPCLRKILTDAAAIEAYEQDPFNPDAIARLRLSAYQKCIVMAYIDNLLDWGDVLFTEFQMETVNEATLLYVQALEILGPRPQDVGDCGQVNENERTYERIAPLVRKGSDFLMEMETYTHTGSGAARTQAKRRPAHLYTIGHAVASHHFNEAANACRRRASYDRRPEPDKEDSSDRAHAVAHHDDGHTGASNAVADGEHDHSPQVRAERGAAHPYHWKGRHDSSRSPSGGKSHKGSRRKGAAKTVGKHESRFAWSVARHVTPVFCVPPNTDLLAYWDRVEDRLYKIRHGMDITGAFRQLSLFAPPINPLLLVEATAAGLSLDDVTNATSGDAPPYRFIYLIDKAKQFASQVQSFGGALLSALEKRDAQQLEVLRVTQQQNILAMTTSTKQAEIDAAQNAVDTLNAQLDTAQFRHDYFQGLIDGWLNPWEILDLGARVNVIGAHGTASLFGNVAGALHLIPQLGSPFSLNYGGTELGDSIRAFESGMGHLASLWESIASVSGTLGGHERRSDGWQHEVDMASKDIAQIKTQLDGAQIRLTIANKALEIHNKTIQQQQQIADFYKARFSNIALYGWMATTLKTAYRHAYSCAYAMAQLTQMAYQFERNDDTIFLGQAYWSQGHAGLLAGELLLGDLQRMEQRFLETNYRAPEITQSFSMMQIAPAALVNLRENATCSFTIPELCFDLFYPGQYFRKIKAVRLGSVEKFDTLVPSIVITKFSTLVCGTAAVRSSSSALVTRIALLRVPPIRL
jgi:hypothetical protein